MRSQPRYSLLLFLLAPSLGHAAACALDLACGDGTIAKGNECVPVGAGGGGGGGATTSTSASAGGTLSCGDGTIEADGMCVPAPVDPKTPSVADMIAYACDATKSCEATKVVDYWSRLITDVPYDGTTWADHAQALTITFRDDGTDLMDYHFEVIETASGTPATLDFEVGRPVTVTLVNPAMGASKPHFLTIPVLYRGVAWWKVEGAGVEYDAPMFDSIGVLHSDAADTKVEVSFVPIEKASDTCYCELGVLGGSDYKGIADGTVTPDFASGHAALGMKETATIADPDGHGLSVFQGQLPSGVMEDDPRRKLTSPAWAGLKGDDGLICTGDANELIPCVTIDITEIDASSFEMIPSSLALVQDQSYVLRITNVTGNDKHVFMAPDFFKDVVLAEARDDTPSTAKTRHLNAVGFAKDVQHRVDLLLIPTVAATYSPYCDIGVQHGEHDGPNLGSGHAGMGMKMTITVAPAPPPPAGSGGGGGTGGM